MAITRLGGANAITGTIPTSVAPGQGKVLQVVQGTYNSSNVNTTSTTYVDTDLEASITPSSTSNKILITGTFQGQATANGIYSLFRGTTNLIAPRGFFRLEVANKQTGYAFSFLDTPSSSSQIEYKLRMKNNGSGTVYFNPGGSDNMATIQLLEIEG